MLSSRDRIYPAARRTAESKGTAVVNSPSHLIKELFVDSASGIFYSNLHGYYSKTVDAARHKFVCGLQENIVTQAAYKANGSFVLS